MGRILLALRMAPHHISWQTNNMILSLNKTKHKQSVTRALGSVETALCPLVTSFKLTLRFKEFFREQNFSSCKFCWISVFGGKKNQFQLKKNWFCKPSHQNKLEHQNSPVLEKSYRNTHITSGRAETNRTPPLNEMRRTSLLHWSAITNQRNLLPNSTGYERLGLREVWGGGKLDWSVNCWWDHIFQQILGMTTRINSEHSAACHPCQSWKGEGKGKGRGLEHQN